MISEKFIKDADYFSQKGNIESTKNYLIQAIKSGVLDFDDDNKVLNAAALIIYSNNLKIAENYIQKQDYINAKLYLQAAKDFCGNKIKKFKIAMKIKKIESKMADENNLDKLLNTPSDIKKLSD